MKPTPAKKKAERAERVREKEEQAEADQDHERAAQDQAPVDLMTLSAVRDLIASRDDNSRARIAAKAAEIRAVALSDEEGRLALYLVHAEGSV